MTGTMTLYRGTVPGEDDVGGQDPVSRHILDVMWFTSCPENAEFFADGEIQQAEVTLDNPIVFEAGTSPVDGPGPWVRGLDADTRTRHDGAILMDIVDGTHPSDVVVVFPRDGTIAHAVRITGRKTYDEDGNANWSGDVLDWERREVSPTDMRGSTPERTDDPMMDAPDILCWTRMQTEAGQPLARIVERKEVERRVNGGLFLWGVGSAPSRAVPDLARRGVEVPVLFSVMKSRPKAQDVAPAAVVAWRSMIDHMGRTTPLPIGSLVTSRAGSRGVHYALVCRSDEPFALSDHGAFDPRAYGNVGGGGAVGASQVTALLERVGHDAIADYRVAMRATLTAGIWVRLTDAVEVDGDMRARIDGAAVGDTKWKEMVAAVKNGSPCGPNKTAQGTLFEG